MDREPQEVTICAASVGGVFAIAGSVAGLVSQVVYSRPLSNTAGLTLFLMFSAGVAALARPRDVRTLTVSIVLVATSMVMELLGRLGILYLPALVLLVVGIGRTEDEREVAAAAEPVATERPTLARPAAARPAMRPMLAAEWDRRIRQAGPTPPVEQPASAEVLRRAG